MAFSWDDCAITRDRFREKSNRCYDGIRQYDYCLTPKVRDGLMLWLRKKTIKYGFDEYTAETVSEDIAELLRKCCGVKDVIKLNTRKVDASELDILKHIGNAIRSKRHRGIYNEAVYKKETRKQCNKRKVVQTSEVKKYLKGAEKH